jgi:hypothetical protein
MNVANAQIMEREVSSGIFDDTRANRIMLIRSLLDALLVTTNSSDTSSTFQELVISVTVRFPDMAINNLAGQALPANTVTLPSAGGGKVIPFGIRLHKSKAFGRKKSAGQVMYVRNHKLCWVVATYYALTHHSVMKQICRLELSALNSTCDVHRRRVRLQILALRKKLFDVLERPAAVILEEALQVFRREADLDIGDSEQATPATYEQLAKGLNLQIIIVDESTNYKATSIFPQQQDPETGGKMNVYDEGRDTIFLLRVRYPVVDFLREGIGSESVHHYHGLVSADGLLRKELKKMCLYCQSIYGVTYYGHRCPAKKRVSCLKCCRGKVADGLQLPLNVPYTCRDFCTPRVGGIEEDYKCDKCGMACDSASCLKEHKRITICLNTSPCSKCGKRFVCLGELEPTKRRFKDALGEWKVEKIYPTAHRNCFHCEYIEY